MRVWRTADGELRRMEDRGWRMEKTGRARSVNSGRREPSTGGRGWRGMLRGTRMPRFKQAFLCLFAGRSKLPPPYPRYEGGRCRWGSEVGGREICARMIKYGENSGN